MSLLAQYLRGPDSDEDRADREYAAERRRRAPAERRAAFDSERAVELSRVARYEREIVRLEHEMANATEPWRARRLQVEIDDLYARADRSRSRVELITETRQGI